MCSVRISISMYPVLANAGVSAKGAWTPCLAAACALWNAARAAATASLMTACLSAAAC